MYFDNFIISESNCKAYNACLDFATAPQGRILIISGASHCGKSHLSYITEKNYREAYPEKKVLVTSCETITNEYISSLETGGADEVRSAVCAFDLLVVDNFQFVSGKTETEKMFALWFSKMLSDNKSVVLITDRASQNLARVIGTQNMVNAHLHQPDVSLRRQYVNELSEKYSIALPLSAKNYLACSLSISFSALAGCFKKLSLIASDNKSLTERQIIDSVIY